jgi:hypothetical protein
MHFSLFYSQSRVCIYLLCPLHTGYKGASDLYIDSNIQLALAAARQIAIDTGKSVHILLPDETEYRRAYKM